MARPNELPKSCTYVSPKELKPEHRDAFESTALTIWVQPLIDRATIIAGGLDGLVYDTLSLGGVRINLGFDSSQRIPEIIRTMHEVPFHPAPLRIYDGVKLESATTLRDAILAKQRGSLGDYLTAADEFLIATNQND